MDRYRKNFRKKVIPRYYSGKFHVVFFSIIELSVILIIGPKCEWKIDSLLVVLMTLGYASTFTYFLHRFLLHRKLPGFGWAFKMHHWHHTFYQSHSMEYDHLDDVYMLLMPPWIQIFYFVIYLPGLVFVVENELNLRFPSTDRPTSLHSDINNFVLLSPSLLPRPLV